MRRFLLVSPYFAPQAALGAYRWVKLARHLPRLGFRPVVLAGTFPDDARDEGLLEALPPEVEVVDAYLDPRVLSVRASLGRLRAWRSAAFGPLGALVMGSGRAARDRAGPIQGLSPFRSAGDRYVAHAPHAARVAVELARRTGAEAVVVSAGPFSACPVGVHVKRALGIPLVLDFRDPWALHETGERPPSGAAERLRRAVVTRLERAWIDRADHLILNTRRTLDAYRRHYPTLFERASFVRNHADPDLYLPVPEDARPQEGRFTIVHAGALRSSTRVDDIGVALAELVRRHRLVPGELVLRQIGRITAFEHRRIAELGLAPYFEAVPPVPYRAILRELRRAHVLVWMFDREATLRIAAKHYDYAAAGRPIVAISSSPEVDELLTLQPDGARVEPGDVAGLVAVLERHLARFRSGRVESEPAPLPPELSSAAAAERVAAILDRLGAGEKRHATHEGSSP